MWSGTAWGGWCCSSTPPRAGTRSKHAGSPTQKVWEQKTLDRSLDGLPLWATRRERLCKARIGCGSDGVYTQPEQDQNSPVWYQAMIWKLSDHIWIWIHLWSAGLILGFQLLTSCFGLVTWPCTFPLPSELVIHQTLSFLLSAVLPSAGPACASVMCVYTLVCVCVCLLIYFFRSLGDALLERTVTIGRVSLPGPSTRPTFVPGKYMQGVFLWPNRASGPPKLSSNTSLHISRMLNAAQHIAHKWNKGTCCDTDALLFLFQYFTWHRVSIYSFFAVYYAPMAHHFETNGISCRPDWFSRVLVHPHHCHWST